jgi:hypothetical protein
MRSTVTQPEGNQIFTKKKEAKKKEPAGKVENATPWSKI